MWVFEVSYEMSEHDMLAKDHTYSNHVDKDEDCENHDVDDNMMIWLWQCRYGDDDNERYSLIWWLKKTMTHKVYIDYRNVTIGFKRTTDCDKCVSHKAGLQKCFVTDSNTDEIILYDSYHKTLYTDTMQIW